MFNPDLYHRTLEFAAKAHQKQLMPSKELPYLLHLTQVCGELMLALMQDSKGLNPDLAISCALLHDTIEDTSIQYEDIEKEFGQRVADGVMALSKNPKLLRPDQMSDSLERILKLSAEVRIVKMADRIVNLQEPPYYWQKTKIQNYQNESKLILERLQGVHPFIEQRLEERIKNYSQWL